MKWPVLLDIHCLAYHCSGLESKVFLAYSEISFSIPNLSNFVSLQIFFYYPVIISLQMEIFRRHRHEAWNLKLDLQFQPSENYFTSNCARNGAQWKILCIAIFALDLQTFLLNSKLIFSLANKSRFSA